MSPDRREVDPFVCGAVPVPNVVFDEVLPSLKDTELRVLLIVLRQTLGRRDGRGRSKARDWLSHAQLVRRTGRGSDAVSGAVASLVRKGLIIAEDSAGRPLGTPEDRRRYIGRLYFRAGDNLGKTGVPDRPGKGERTTHNKNKSEGLWMSKTCWGTRGGSTVGGRLNL